MPSPLRTLTFRCRGHRNIKATHAKTLEWTREIDISPRATCIIGVSADFDPVEAARLRGPLRITMRVAGTDLGEEVHAFATPLAAARDSLVLRCSNEQGGQTFAFGADKGAAALGREWVRALEDPAASLEVTVEELPPPQPAWCGALLLACSPAENLSGEAAARLAAVDEVVTLSEMRGARPGSEALLLRLRQGERIALVGDPLDPVARDLAGNALAAGVTVSPLWGVTPWLAVAATTAGTHPIHLEPDPIRKPAAFRKALDEARHRPAVTLLPVELPPVVILETLEESLPDRELTLGWELLTRRERLLRGTPEEMRERWGEASRDPRHAESLIIAIPPAETQDDLGILAPVFETLLDQGVAVRSLADAAARWPNLSRKQAYAALLRLSEALAEEKP